MIIRLLGFAPDADPTIVGILTNCAATVPSLRGMRGAPSPASTGITVLAGTCQGAAVITKLDSSTRLFAGTSTKLYEASGLNWADVSRAAAYTPNSTQRWRFAQFGNVSLAANGNDTMQASVSSGAFSCIGSGPQAAVVETVNQFAFAFNTAATPDGWQCSALGDYTSWAASIATQAASGRLTATSGPVTAGRRFGDSIVAYKKQSMYIGVYVGAPLIWSFTQIPGVVGAMSQEAVVNIGTSENPKHIFMGEDNFYLFDGAKPTPIGTNRVKVKVFTELLQSRYYACAALHDRINALVYFYYPVSDSVQPDHCVVYNYRTDQWGVDDRQIEIPIEYLTPGVAYDNLGASYSTYDSLPNLPYDYAFLNSNFPVPAIFDTTHSAKTLSGAAGASSITTGDVGDDLVFSTLQRVRPRFITAPTSGSMTNFYRNDTGGTLTMDVSSTMQSDHRFDVLREARWHRVTMQFSGDWEMSGFAPEWTLGGLE